MLRLALFVDTYVLRICYVDTYVLRICYIQQRELGNLVYLFENELTCVYVSETALCTVAVDMFTGEQLKRAYQ